MDIVVRTPHGDADVSIASHAPTTTLGDVVAAVTGQAVPRVVSVDTDIVDATTLLDDVGLRIGAVVISEPPLPTVTSESDVDLVQVAGHGAGRMTRLSPGRYRIGPGRRTSAAELAVAPVERTEFELVVESTSWSTEVSVVPPTSDATAPELMVDGRPVDHLTPWHQGTLTFGARAFHLDNPARPAAGRPRPMPDRDGTVTFSRPPRRLAPTDRRPIVDAVLDATLGAPTLWERRSNDPDAFVVPVGVRADDATPITVDLGANRAVAVTGSERFRSALVRSLVVEAVALHGPADLDLVVLAESDRVAQWDWAKWLPHLRCDGRLDGPPAIWSSRHDIDRWSEHAQRRSPSDRTRSRLTLVILDGPALWNRRDAPARSTVSGPPEHLRLIALCDEESQAPAVCTIAISEADDGLALIHSFTRAGDDEIARPALTEPDVAVQVARALAPLADVDLAPQDAAAVPDGHPLELSALIGVTGVDDVLARWAASNPRSTATIGRRGRESVDVGADAAVTVVVGPSMGDAFDVAATMLLAQCVERSPGDMWLAPIPLEHSPRSALLWRLPHSTDRHDVDSPIVPARLLARLRALLADPAGPVRIVLVTEAGASTALSSGESWLGALADGVRAISGATMVVVTDRPDLAELVGGTVIRVERRYDQPGTARRVARFAAPDGTPGEPFTTLQPTASATDSLALRPFVVGRALTPLERRIEHQHAQASNTPDAALDSVVTVLVDAASRHRDHEPPDVGRRTVVPTPVPTRVDLDELFASAPGDGVPIGFVDDPGRAGVRTLWWQPGEGSMLVFGSRRSGMEQLITTITLGVIDRFSALDVRLVIIEPSSTRRRAFGDLGRHHRVVDPDRPDEVNDALDDVVAELDRSTGATSTAGPAGRPRTVLLIGDLTQLRRRHANQPVGSRIDEVVTRAAAPGSGVDVVASATELDGAGPFAAAASTRLVGASSDLGELAALGVDDSSDLDGIVGRCRSFPDRELVQLATTDASIETLLARRSIGGPT
jgi:DNA segregation ATPase FtsK/SpoIIIE, S-DNA-T family